MYNTIILRRVHVYRAVPYCTILLYYTIAGHACFLINTVTHRKLFIHQRTAVWYGTVWYGNTVRNGHDTVPARHLHCIALNENGNFFVHYCTCNIN